MDPPARNPGGLRFRNGPGEQHVGSVDDPFVNGRTLDRPMHSPHFDGTQGIFATESFVSDPFHSDPIECDNGQPTGSSGDIDFVFDLSTASQSESSVRLPGSERQSGKVIGQDLAHGSSRPPSQRGTMSQTSHSWRQADTTRAPPHRPTDPGAQGFGVSNNIDRTLTSQESSASQRECAFGFGKASRNTEATFERLLQLVDEAGFANFDAMATEYYTAPFAEDSISHDAQSRSRRRFLRVFLTTLQRESQHWSDREVQGYRQQTTEAAECLYREEVSRAKQANPSLVSQAVQAPSVTPAADIAGVWRLVQQLDSQPRWRHVKSKLRTEVGCSAETSEDGKLTTRFRCPSFGLCCSRWVGQLDCSIISARKLPSSFLAFSQLLQPDESRRVEGSVGSRGIWPLVRMKLGVSAWEERYFGSIGVRVCSSFESNISMRGWFMHCQLPVS